jgi:hypothetical protein
MEDQNQNSEDKRGFIVDLPLKIHVRDDKHHLIRQFNLDDLKAIELKFPNTMVQRTDGTIEKNLDNIDLKLFMWDRVILEVEGYGKLPEKTWKEKIPFQDKIMVANELYFYMIIDDESDVDHYFPGEKVQDIPGKNMIYAAAKQAKEDFLIIHVFNQVESRHAKTFESVSAYKQKVKKSKVIWKSKQEAESLVDLYDELIEKVTGYTVSEGDFSPEQVPPLHKLKTVNALFSRILNANRAHVGN